MNKKQNYYLNESSGEFVIENYNLAKPFSSFFPGIAGAWGVPIWVFYVNRGQAISSFGIKDKDHPVLEFQPANKAYQLTSILGFRTLIKLRKGRSVLFYDAFHNGASSAGFDIENRMLISPFELTLQETNRTLGIEVNIKYFTIPNDNYGGLARILTVRNLGKVKNDLEIIDGLPQIIPYGLTNMFLKKLPRTIEAWMAVENLDNKVPYLRLKVDPTDRPEVMHILEGNFYLTFDNRGLIKPIVDPEAIFGHVSDFTYPQTFLESRKYKYPNDQLSRSKTPSCMSYFNAAIKPDGEISLYTLAGNMASVGKLNSNVRRIANKEYLDNKRSENKQLICDLVSSVETHSSSRSFDLYCRQNFLDNVMRGGYPLSFNYLPRREIHIQTYSRKHGDPERDYNKFLLEPTYFSQGNGNYRDVNQNRRSDMWFNSYIKEENVRLFFNLIQSDGYNPLVIKPDSFVFNGDCRLLSKFFKDSHAGLIGSRLREPFTPGELLYFIEVNGISIAGSGKPPAGGGRPEEEFLIAVLAHSTRMVNAEHGEGFWIDHWTYCLDILESYIRLYPEKLKEILLEKEDFTFYDNSEFVRPRREKYFLRSGRVFQFHAVGNNHAKHNFIAGRRDFPHLMRGQNGQGGILRTCLIVKMLTVIANKYSSLDPFGVGIEMEADKPNWYDSLNGLPAMLGSSTCETFELKRWIVFLKDSFDKIAAGGEYIINLPVELYDLLAALERLSKERLSLYDFWDRSHNSKEDYRSKTVMGFSGLLSQINLAELNCILDNFLVKIDAGLRKAYSKDMGLHFSYFINEVIKYEPVSSSEGVQLARPLKFRQRPLPLFLEGIMHCLRVEGSRRKAEKIFKAVRKSSLFDKKLKMYKVNASLEGMPEEIGRCRVFTPGWLENESIWLHMEYKYILELLKKGLYKEFFEDFKNVLIPFQDPGRYGRSNLENSSFLVSSAFPQKKLHGNGFVARLSGSTAEFIHIWLVMCAGCNPFYLRDDNTLCLEFKPILPSWLFSRKEESGFHKNTFAFKFMNKTTVVYHNPERKDTFGPSAARIKKIVVEVPHKPKVTFKSSRIEASLASDIRSGRIPRVDIYLG